MIPSLHSDALPLCRFFFSLSLPKQSLKQWLLQLFSIACVSEHEYVIKGAWGKQSFRDLGDESDVF